jgi:hypothetical protein
MNNTYIPFTTSNNIKNNIFAAFLANIVSWAGYEYTKRTIDSSFYKDYQLIKYKRI